MKNFKIIIKSCGLGVVSFFATSSFVFAGGVPGAGTGIFDASNLSANTAGAGASAVSAGIEGAQLARSAVLDVVANQLQNQLILQLQTDVVNWAKSGFYGQPAFIKSPETYFSNLSKVAIRVQLNKFQAQTGDPEIDRIVTNIVRTQRIDEQAILDKVKSDLGTVVKSNICNDNALTDVARSDVAKSIGKTSLSIQEQAEATILTEINNRKREIYNSLCLNTGASAVTGAGTLSNNSNGFTQSQRPVTQAQINASQGAQNKALEDAFRNNFLMGGYASFIALTQPNNNAFQRQQTANESIQKSVASKVQTEKDQLLQGGGYNPQRECKKYSQNESQLQIAEANGVSRDTYCEEWENKTAPSETQNNVNSSIRAPTERLANTQGFGAILTQAVLAGVMARVINEAKGAITGSFRGTTANSSISVNSNNFLTLDQVLNTAPINTGSVTQTGQNDLLTSQDKANSTQAISKVLRDDMTSLVELEEATVIARASILRYQPYYEQLEVCRNTASSLPNFRTQEPGISVEAGYLERKQEFEKLNRQTNNYIRDIPGYMAIVAEAQNKINSASSSQLIRDVYQEYENSKTSGSIPGPGETGIYRAQAGSLKSRVDIELDETLDDNSSRQKTIRQLITNCQAMICISFTVSRDGKKVCNDISTNPINDLDRINNPKIINTPESDGSQDQRIGA